MFAFARRHAWPLAAAALVVVAGFALLVQSLLAEHRLAAERDLALASAERARVEAAKSEQVAGFVQSMLAGIDPDRAHGMDRSLLRLILDAAGERAGRELDGQPAVRAAIERTIAQSYNGIGEYELAIEHFDAALDATAAAGHAPAERVSLLVRKARALGNLGRTPDATAVARQAVAAAAVLPADSRERLFADASVAGFECDAGRFQACHDGYTRVLAVQRSALGDADRDTLESMHGLAIADSRLARHAEADALFKELIARYREQSGGTSSRVFAAITSLANDYMDQDRNAEAEALLKPALAQAEQTFGANHPGTLAMSLNLGTAINSQPGRSAEARPYFEKALSTALALYGEDGRTTVFAETNLADLLRDAGELDAAEHHARTAIEHMDRALGVDSPYRGAFLDTLASILIARHEYAEAERVLDRAYAILSDEGGFGPDHPRTQTAIGHYVDLYTAWKHPAQVDKWRARLAAPAATANAAR
jgi:non-specific serine/threonine protein kinase/serine/threonine-protein kinase